MQLSGQTGINIAEKLSLYGIKILGTPLHGIDTAEDREKFRKLLQELSLPQPANATAVSKEGAMEVAKKIGYPLVVRPSYVIAGAGMRIVHSEQELLDFIEHAVDVSEQKPVLLDKYLDNAIECEVDAVSDGNHLLIGGIMEHIEYAGVHSGDANIVIPSIRLSDSERSIVIKQTEKIANALGVVGLINIQYAVKEGTVFVLEANPRASRTIPFVSKAVNLPLAKIATKVMLGEPISNSHLTPINFSVKSVVFPFLKITGSDVVLGPEMKSTGESMGMGNTFEIAYYKALIGAGLKIPKEGKVLISLKEEDKPQAVFIESLLRNLNFSIYATPGTAACFKEATIVQKIGKGQPDVLDFIDQRKVDLIINTPTKGSNSHTDGFRIRRAAIEKNIPCITNLQTALELLKAISKIKPNDIEVKRLKEYSN